MRKTLLPAEEGPCSRPLRKNSGKVQIYHLLPSENSRKPKFGLLSTVVFIQETARQEFALYLAEISTQAATNAEAHALLLIR